MKYKKILFVCTGNTCRSPMAEIIFRKLLKEQGVKWVQVRSAGISAETGNSLNPQSATALQEKGYEVPIYRARKLTKKMLENADVVVCMTENQAQKLSGFSSVTSMFRLVGREIADPYGRGFEAYRETLASFEETLPLLVEKLYLK